MAWKWYPINSYKVSVGSDKPASGDGSVQLIGTNFYGFMKFAKSGGLPAATAPVIAGQQRFSGPAPGPEPLVDHDVPPHVLACWCPVTDLQ